MRQVMPHRNNMFLRRSECKIFLGGRLANARCATFPQQCADTRMKGLVSKLQGFTGASADFPLTCLLGMGISDMRHAQFFFPLTGRST